MSYSFQTFESLLCVSGKQKQDTGLFLTVCLLCKIIHVLFLSLDFFQNQLFRKILSGIPSECHRVLDPDQAPSGSKLFTKVMVIRAQEVTKCMPE